MLLGFKRRFEFFVSEGSKTHTIRGIPRDKCSFRGLSIGKKGHTLLSKWLGDLRVRQLPGSVSHAD